MPNKLRSSALEVVLRHYANTVCSVVCIAYVLARAVKILQCKGEVGRYVVEDVAEDILADTAFVCILVAEFLEDASVGRVDKINDLYDYCLEHGISFVAATSSGEEDIELWRKRTGAEYPVYWADNLLLRSMTRANPGVLLLDNGVIVGKWNVAVMPEAEQMMSSMSHRKVKDEMFGMDGKLFWTLLFVLPLVVIVLIDLATGRKKRAVKEETPVE